MNPFISPPSSAFWGSPICPVTSLPTRSVPAIRDLMDERPLTSMPYNNTLTNLTYSFLTLKKNCLNYFVPYVFDLDSTWWPAGVFVDWFGVASSIVDIWGMSSGLWGWEISSGRGGGRLGWSRGPRDSLCVMSPRLDLTFQGFQSGLGPLSPSH